MSTIEELRKRIDEERKRQQEAQQQINTAKKETSTLEYRRRLEGLRGLRERQRVAGEIANAEENIKQSSEWLNTQEKGLQDYESAVAEVEADRRAYERAKEIFLTNSRWSGKDDRVRYYLERMEEDYAGTYADVVARKQAPYKEFSDKWNVSLEESYNILSSQKNIDTFMASRGYYGKSTAEGIVYEQLPIKDRELILQQTRIPQKNTKEQFNELIKNSVEEYKTLNPRPKLYGQPTEYAVLTKGSVGYQITLGIGQTIKTGIDYVLPEKTRAQLWNEARVRNDLPYKLAVGGGNMFLSSVGYGAVGPVISNTQAYINRVNPEFRVKPLAPKQNPRSVGVDVVQLENNQIMFKEKIVIPRRMQTVNTQLGDYFNLKPYRTTYSPQVTLIQESVTPMTISPEGDIIDGGLVMVHQIKPYKPSYTYYQLRGGARIQDFANYKPEKPELVNKLFKNAGQSAKAGGLNYLKDNQELFTASIESREVITGKTSSGQDYVQIAFKFKGDGKRITSSDIVGIQTKVAEFPETDVYTYKFVGEETTMPTMRPRTNQVTKGFSVVNKQTGSTSNIYIKDTVLKSNNNKAVLQATSDVFSKQAAKVKVKPVEQIKPVSKYSPELKVESKVSPAPVLRKSETIISIPSSDNSQQLLKPQQSAYYGQGTYEKTQEVASIKPSETVRDLNGASESVINISGSSSRSNSGQLPLPRQDNIVRDKLEVVPKLRINPRQEVLPRQILNIRQSQIQNTIMRMVAKKINARNKTINPRFFGVGKSKESSKQSLGNDEFEIFSFKKKKEVKLGAASTLQSALQKARRLVDENINASFFLKRGGKKVTLSGLNVPGFRPSKRRQDVLVEAEGLRLSLGGEKRQIKSARRKFKLL